MNDFITSEGLLDTFAYLDNVTICGKNQAHPDYNLERFLKAAKSINPKNAFFVRELLIFSEMWLAKEKLDPILIE